MSFFKKNTKPNETTNQCCSQELTGQKKTTEREQDKKAGRLEVSNHESPESHTSNDPRIN